jgi:cyclopentanol dehydrogenase
MSKRLEGKVALITGGARGIGAAHVRVFAENGAKLVVGDVLADEGAAVIAEARKGGADAVFVSLDVSREEDWEAAVAEATKRFGKLTTLVNNAPIANLAGVEEETIEGWNRVIAVDQLGVWLGMKIAIPAMLTHGGGSIVNISSLYGIIGSPGMIAYHAAKGAVRLMTKSAALEYAARGIRINSVHPGIIDTPLAGALLPEDYKTRLLEVTPMKRIGRPEEIAHGSVFLASDEASFVTGSELVIDGGWLAQ